MTIMDTRNSDKPVSVKSAKSPARAIDFVGDVKGEIQRIHWTGWDELKTYTQIIVMATFALGIGIYFTDLCIQNILTVLSYLVQTFVG